MRTIYNMNLLNTECPAQMNEQNCPLRKYLDSPASALRISINETLLMPKTYDMDELVKSINQIRTICQDCKAQNNKQH